MRRLSQCIAALLCFALLYSIFFKPHKSVELRQTLQALSSLPDRFFGKPVLLLLGDSRVSALRCKVWPHGGVVVNLGISGLTARELRAKLEIWTAGLRVERAVLWIGVNDMLNHKRHGEAVSADIQAVLEILAARATRVAVIDPIPVIPVTGSGATGSLEADEIARVLGVGRDAANFDRRDNFGPWTAQC